MSPGGIIFAMLTGLLAVYFFIGQSTKINNQQDESKSEHRCKSAEFDLDFSEKWNDPKEKIEKLKKRVEKECATFETKRTENTASSNEKLKTDKEISDAINQMLK